MHRVDPIDLEHQFKRWMRPDAHHFVRPDWRRFVRPEFQADQPRDDHGRWTDGAARSSR